MDRSVHDAIYYIQTNENIHLSEKSRKAIEEVHYGALRTKDAFLMNFELEKIKYFNELKLWAKRSNDTNILSLIETLENGGSIR
jgi:hypothetical protein